MQTSAKWWPATVKVGAQWPRISTSQGASVRTQTVASVRPTWRSSGPTTSPGMLQPCSSGAIVSPASCSCSQYSSAGSRWPLQTIARPVLWIRLAIA
jgi:hypothetical protein